MSEENTRVILEKISNLDNKLSTMQQANDNQHKTLMKAQRHTNGDVSKLKIWKAYLTGAIAVLSLLFGYFMTDYLKNHDTIITLRSDLEHLKNECHFDKK